MRTKKTARWRAGRSAAAVLLAALVVLSGSTIAHAEEPGFVTIKKTASVANVAPGETFSFQLVVGCTSFGAGCTSAKIADAIPPQFIIEGTPVVGAGAPGVVNVSGQDVTVTFTSPLDDPPGAIGLEQASTGTVTITVRVDPDLPYSANGMPIDNTGIITASNAVSMQSVAAVTPTVPLKLATIVTKTIEPAGAEANPGAALTATIGATNTSNAAVDSLTLTDPSAPSAIPSPFEYLGFTGFGTVSYPEGADSVRVDVWDGAEWVNGFPAAAPTLPPGVAAAGVLGVRLTFTNASGGKLSPGAAASVGLELVQRDTVTDLIAVTTVTNSVTSEVAVGAESRASDPAIAQYAITPLDMAIEATKDFSPSDVLAGEPSTATLTATNVGTPVDSLTIIEPDPALTPNPFESGLAFTGFGADGVGEGIVWPLGATGASVTFTFADGNSETVPATAGNTLPAPPPGEVVGFAVTFTGVIVTGGEAKVPFAVATSAEQSSEELGHLNRITAEAVHGALTISATAEETLTTYQERLAVTVEKKINPSRIPSVPGEIATVQLPTHLEPSPASTTKAERIVVQDPRVVPPSPAPDAWWNSFDARAITQTAIPAGATLSVRYWDGSAWLPLPGAQDLVGPQIVNTPIPAGLRDAIQGLQFDFANPEGFPPGTTVQPNFSTRLRADHRDDSGPAAGAADIIENCASVAADGIGATAASETPVPCPTIELVPTTPGIADLIEKDFIGTIPGAGKTVIARSGNLIDAQLSWSTGGFSGLSEMIISDVADPAAIPVSESVFNAFNLVAIPAISPAQDQWLKYDAVARVELFNGADWVAAANDPCPTLCDASFPGATLTAVEQETTTGARLVFVESPNRAAASTDPAAPQVGDGVARSVGNDRKVLLSFQVRDLVREPRSAPDPVLGSREYNVPGTPGDVLNVARAQALIDDEIQFTDTDHDTAVILDVPLNVEVTKSWAGGPLGIPPGGTSPDAYPSGRVTVKATNVTAARVDSLTITEPATAAPADDPFNTFDIKRIVTVSVPVGAISTDIILRHSDGSSTTVTRAVALGMESDELADVVGMTVVHGGRIEAGAESSLVFDARLRATDRGTLAPVTVVDSPVKNRIEADVEDLGGTGLDTPMADDIASMALEAMDISVTAGKRFDPLELTEPASGPVTMTLSGKPGGSSRTKLMVLTDDDTRFWNQYDFKELAPLTLTAPITRVRVDALVGGTYGTDANGPTLTGADWINGRLVTGANAALPYGVNPSDVQGLRFTFMRADESIWENPAAPTQNVPIVVKRRATLQTGGPVPTDLPGNAAAPGESVAGVASNVVDAMVEGAVYVDGQPVSAIADAAASILYRHATNSVKVVKKANGSTAGGIQTPAQEFPYTLEVTNTGDVPIVNPVITDRLPSDALGTQLVFNPEVHPGGDGAFGYALTGGAPAEPNGPALPTDPAEVGTAIQGDVEEIAFTFPPGTVLEVGQTYTITATVMMREGITGGVNVVNDFGVSGDRPWDECEGILDAATGECQASATITVGKAGALRANKTVRAVDDELGNIVNNGSGAPSTPDTGQCQPDASGFYRAPCVPVTKPGGNEVWRINYTNTGNLPMNELTAVDRLPDVGDTGAGNPLPRGSQWRPLFEGTVTLVNVPAGAVAYLLWSDDEHPCIAGPACPPDAWTSFPQDGGPAFDPQILDSITGVLIDIRFEGELLEPLGQISIDIVTTTPAFSPTEGPDTIAWNSAGATAFTIDGTDVQRVPATEGKKVGVAMATGPISVVKQVIGEGAQFAPDNFALTLSCVSAVGTEFEAEVPLGARGNLTVDKDQPVTVADLPWGAECTVAEDAAAGSAEFTANTQAVQRDPQDPALITAMNRYDLAELIVSKEVNSAAVDEAGEAIDYGEFFIEVGCSFVDEPAYAEGFGPTKPMEFNLGHGGEVALKKLPAGAACEVMETNAQGAASTTITATAGQSEPVIIEGASATIELASEFPEGDVNSVAVTNNYDVGSILIEKQVVGPGAGLYGVGPFIVQVQCTLPDVGGSIPVYDGDVSLSGADPLTKEIQNVALGAVCSFTEPQTAGATTSSISPESWTVANAGEISTIMVTNTFEVGSLVVDKVVAGAGATFHGAGPFEISLSCTLPDAANQEIEIPGGAAREFSVGTPAQYDNLPVGAVCRLVESQTGGATSSAIAGGVGGNPAIVEIVEEAPGGAGAQARRTVTNTFAVGQVRVIKRLSGPGAPSHQGDEFVFQISCLANVNGAQVPIIIPGGDSRTVSAATNWISIFSELPQGAECSIVETTLNGADKVEVVIGGQAATVDEVTPSDPPTLTVPLSDTSCAAVEVINTWNSASGAAAGGRRVVGPTDVEPLRIDVGCAPAPRPGPGPESGSGLAQAPSEYLAWTGANVAVLAALAILLAGGGCFLVRRGGRRASNSASLRHQRNRRVRLRCEMPWQ